MALFFGGWIVLAIALLVTQMRFYRAHQRRHGLWRPRVDQWVMTRTAAEYRAMVRATFTRDRDGVVERLRRQYLVVLGLLGVYAVVGFPTAGLLLG